MTFEALNDTVMLVELSCEEMKKYHITYENLNYNNKTVQEGVKKLLEVIKASDKYNTDDKITIEALPINNGGCFFIFTFSPKRKTRYKMKKAERSICFKAESVDNLLDFILSVKKIEHKNCNCEIYKMKGDFYIEIPAITQKINAVAREFGQISSIRTEHLKEFGEKAGLITI